MGDYCGAGQVGVRSRSRDCVPPVSSKFTTNADYKLSIFQIFRSMVGSPVPPRPMRRRRPATCPSVPTRTGVIGPAAEENFAELERLEAGQGLATAFLP